MDHQEEFETGSPESRRNFLRDSAIFTFLSGISVTFSACETERDFSDGGSDEELGVLAEEAPVVQQSSREPRESREPELESNQTNDLDVAVSDPPVTPPPSVPSDISGSITGPDSPNHGHTSVVTSAVLVAGVGVTVGLSTGGGHTHSATLSTGEIQSLLTGGSVSVTSTSDFGHFHTVAFG